MALENPNAFLILTDGFPPFTVPDGAAIEVIGSGTGDTINVDIGGSVSLSNPGTGSVININGNAADYTVVATDVAEIELVGPNGEVIVLGAENEAQQLVFLDGAADFGIVDGALDLGGQAITETAETVAPPDIDPDTTSEGEFGPVVEAPVFDVTSDGPTTEGETVTFTVSLSNAPSDGEFSVDFAIGLEGGATADDHGDITVDGVVDNSGSGTLTFAPGESSKTITIPVTSDLETPEEGEGISVTLSNPTGTDAVIGTGSTTADITDVFPFTLTQSPDDVEEGDDVVYTLTAVTAVAEDTDVSFVVVPGDVTAEDQGTDQTNLNDFDQGSFNPFDVTIPAGETEVSFTLTTVDDGDTELPEFFSVEATVNGVTVDIETLLLDGSGINLTTNADTLTGTVSDDLFSASLGTLNAGDFLEGLGGDDTLDARVNATIGAPTILEIENLEFETAIAATDIALTNVSGFTSVLVEGNQDFTFGTGDTLAALPAYTLSGFDETLTLSHADTALESQDADAAVLDFTLEDVEDATIQIDLATGTGTAEIVDDLQISSDGSSANSVELAFENTIDDITKVTIDGAQDLELTLGDATTEFADTTALLDDATIDATALTGDLDIVSDATGNIDASGIDGLDELTLTGNVNGTVSSLEEGADVEVTGTTTTAVTIEQLGADVAGSLDDVIDVALNPEATSTHTAVTINDVETINLTSTTSATDASTVTNTITTFTADALVTLDVDGDADLVITAFGAGNQVDIIDASGLSADFTSTVATTNTAAVAFTGASGVNTFTGSGFDDAITGGASADILTGGAGADVLTGGEGADDFTYSADADGGTAGTLSADEGDDITDFLSGTDTFSFIGDFLTADLTGTVQDGVNEIANAGGLDLDAVGSGDDTVQLIAGDAANTAALADLFDIADLQAALGTLSNEAAGDERILIFNSSDGDAAAIYKYTEDTGTDNTLSAGELQLLGVTGDNIAAEDILFA